MYPPDEKEADLTPEQWAQYYRKLEAEQRAEHCKEIDVATANEVRARREAEEELDGYFPPLPESIGKRIQRLREKKGWSLDRLKDEAGLNGIAVGIMVGIEDGSWGIPKPAHLYGLAVAFDVPVEYLMTGKDD